MDKTRYYKKSDYEWLVLWWKFHGVEIMPEHCIPASSFISEDKDGPAAFGSVYLTNSTLALAENMISRPNLKREDRWKHVNAAMKMGQDFCDKLGFKIMSFCDQNNVESFLDHNGFKKIGSGMDLYYRENKGS